ncbi:MAG: DUF2971 domain-containing protein [bacterium]|nr:DUF2971 domain-containing protein [bacterium]
MGNTPKRLYKYINMTAAKTVLSTERIRMTSPRNFNDPFDCALDVVIDLSDSDIEQGIRELIAELLAAGKKPVFNDIAKRQSRHYELLEANVQSKWDSVQRFERSVESCTNDIMQNGFDWTYGFRKKLDYIRTLWKEIQEDILVFCLSEVHDNLTMWAHYADNYAGVVIEFSVVENQTGLFDNAIKVEYVEEIPLYCTKRQAAEIICGFADPTPILQKGLDRLSKSKGRQWANEQEWRVLRSGKMGDQGVAYAYHSICRESVTTVYFGHKANHIEILEICEILKKRYPNARCYMLSPSENAFKLEHEEIEL